MAYLRLLLLPFSVLYGLIVWIRNRLYDWGWLKSTTFNSPVIVIGNLAVGGTGKSPMTEYLIRLLGSRYQLATLSRGYGRKTQGFLEVSTAHTVAECGDEPLQFKHKFPHITIAVGEDRAKGVSRLIQNGHDAIVLDDAFQHRALRPGLAILLFDYQAMGKPKWLLPAGNYRDCFQERRRADIMIVTKTPTATTEHDKERIRSKLAIARDIPILFSSIGYGTLLPVFPADEHPPIPTAQLQRDFSLLVVTGIANPVPLHNYLATQVNEVSQLRYPDHHDYTPNDIQQIVNRFTQIANPLKLIVTTEKDAQRFSNPILSTQLKGLPIYMLPIHAQFNEKDESLFQQLVLDYCKMATKSLFL